ncbi:hypothetical protein PSEUDO9AZ_10725 [Pseudomonas sp. 9AZ]|nr:hypothetical protein PSEUDO9AZ_10725 [Pseudomonas sp. 9AZ]
MLHFLATTSRSGQVGFDAHSWPTATKPIVYKLEDQSGVRHLIAGHLKDRSDLLDGLDVRSRNFH